jgi:hypothetical protein
MPSVKCIFADIWKFWIKHIVFLKLFHSFANILHEHWLSNTLARTTVVIVSDESTDKTYDNIETIAVSILLYDVIESRLYNFRLQLSLKPISQLNLITSMIKYLEVQVQIQLVYFKPFPFICYYFSGTLTLKCFI